MIIMLIQISMETPMPENFIAPCLCCLGLLAGLMFALENMSIGVALSALAVSLSVYLRTQEWR